MKQKKYDKARTLDDRQQAREKLHVWFGSRGNYYHGFREVCINNPIDEISNNFESGNIYITLHDDKRTLTVKDTGRGMPISIKDDDGIPYWYIYLQKMFGSGKYDLEEDNSGTNGLGSTVTNYTSDLYDVTSYFDGNIYHIGFENGGNIKVPFENLGQTEEHGTIVTFKLEEDCYSVPTIYDENILKDIIDKASSVSPKVTIHFIYNGEETIYHYSDVIKDYYLNNIENDESKLFKLEHKEIIKDDELNKIDCIFSKSFKPIQLSFLNKNNLIEGGTIDKGLIEGIRQFVNKYARDNNMLPKGLSSISINDVSQSINYMISYNSNNVEYQSQTKFSTNKDLYRIVAKDYIINQLDYISIVEKDKFEDLVNHIIDMAKLNNSFKEKKKIVSAKRKERVSRKKLSDCTSKNPLECEISIVEGDSAGGSAKNANDKKFQAVLSTRGKIPNVIKQKLEDVLKNEEFRIFAQAINIGIQEEFDESKLRYYKIIIMTDADVDGLHIRTLWITFIYKYYKELIETGHLYISQPPLYMLHDGKEDVYLYSDKELEDKLKELGTDGKSNEIQRFKGLGEMSADQMALTTMNPETRRLYQVKIEDCEKLEKILKDLMDDDSEPRKKFVRENSKKSHLIN